MKWKKITACAVFLSMYAVFAQEKNLIPNPGFEEDIGIMWKVPGWVWKTPQGEKYFEPSVDATTSQGPVGSRSLKLHSDGTKSTTWLPMRETGPRIGLLENVREYTLSMWVKNEMPQRKGNENVGRLELILSCLGEGKKTFRKTIITPWERLLPEWTRISADVTIPDGYDTFSLLLKFSGTKSVCTTWVDNLYFGPKQIQRTAPVKTAVKTDRLVRAVHSAKHDGIYYPGEKVQYELHFRNLVNPGKKAELNWSALDFDSREIGKGKMDIVLERRVDITLPIPENFMGYFNVKMDISSNGKYLDGGMFSGMVINKQNTKPDPFFSTRGCRSYEKHVRMGFGPRVMEPGSSIAWVIETSKGKYNFQPKDQMLESALAEGYTDLYSHTHFSTGMIPRYKRKEYEARIIKGENPYTEQDFEDYRTFCRTAIARYGKNISSWRVPDEIMLIRHNPRCKLGIPLYHKFCRIFYEELKKQFPEKKLYAGGAMFGEAKYQDLKKDVWDKIKDCVDGLCVDAYTQGASVGIGQNFLGPEQLNLREKYIKTFKATGVREFVNEETGAAFQRDLPLNHPVFKDYAVKNARIITMAKSLNQVKGWTHFLIEDAQSAWNGNFDYAAWKNFNPRPHAYTLALVNRELAYATDGIEVKPHADIYAYVFKRSGKTLLAIWGMSSLGISGELQMPSDWKGRSVTGEEISGKKGSAKLKLTDRPFYIELDAPQETVAESVMKGRYALPEAVLTVNRKSGNTVCVFVENKTNKEFAADVSLNGSESKRISLPPLSNLPVEFTCAPGKTLDASAKINGTLYTLSRKEELFFVEELSASPAMDGTLKGFEKITPLVFDRSDALQPIDAGAWGYWTGPKDLSAKLYLAYDKKYFYIAADVLDDIHVSRYSNAMIWNQDCVQFAFDTENDTFDPKKSRGGFNPDDREFCMALTPEGPQLYCYTAPLELVNKPVPDKATVVSRDGRIIYCARIPWKYFGKLGPKSGSVFGFNVIFFDLDDKSDIIPPYRMQLSPGIADGKSPADFKRFMLK